MAATRESSADHDIRARQLVEQGRDVGRVVLAVGIDLDDRRVAVGQRVLEPEAHRAAHPEVVREFGHEGTGLTRDERGGVG